MENRRDPADVVVLMLFDEPLDDGRLRAAVEEHLLTKPRFRRRVVDSWLALAPPRWEDESDFSLDAHFRRHRLVHGGDEALAGLVSDIVNEPIDFRRSPWSLVVVDGVGNGSALVARVHHCMGDGFALLDILLSLADAPKRSAGPPDSGGRQPAAKGQGWWGWSMTNARVLRELTTALWQLVALPFDPPTRLRNMPSGERRIAWSEPVPLERVKELARAHDATVNDVLMAALAGACRRYMLQHGERPTPFRAIVPVNLRPPDERTDGEAGNWFGLIFLELPLDVSPPAVRLARLQQAMGRIKQSKQAAATLGILAALGRSPLFVDRLVQGIFARKGSMVVTNLRGPADALCVAGSRLREMCFWVPHPCGLGCGASILSYAGSVRVAFRTDAAVIPDPEALVRCLRDELATFDAVD
jgi:diacylglycerol O-acyltransferase